MVLNYGGRLIKLFLSRISSLIVWQFRKKKFNNTNLDSKSKEILNSLESNSYYIYKNFLNSNKLKVLKKDIKKYCKSHPVPFEKTIYYRSRTKVPHDKKFLKFYVKNKIVREIMNNFHLLPVDIDKTSYEIKKGLKNKKNVSGEHFFHIDRNYGVLKFALFLTNIEIKNGPFSIIPGSHKFSKSYSLRSFFYKLFHFFIEGKKDKIPMSKINNFVDLNSEKFLLGKSGDLLIVNTGAYHRGSDLKPESSRELIWIYTISPNYLSHIRKKITF